MLYQEEIADALPRAVQREDRVHAQQQAHKPGAVRACELPVKAGSMAGVADEQVLCCCSPLSLSGGWRLGSTMHVHACSSECARGSLLLQVLLQAQALPEDLENGGTGEDAGEYYTIGEALDHIGARWPIPFPAEGSQQPPCSSDSPEATCMHRATLQHVLRRAAAL